MFINVCVFSVVLFFFFLKKKKSETMHKRCGKSFHSQVIAAGVSVALSCTDSQS